MFEPPKTQPWHHTITVGAFVLQEVHPGVFVYQHVVGMTRAKKITRQVKGFSCMCEHGEIGDTYLGNIQALVDPALWAVLKDADWPSSPYALPFRVFCEVEDRNGILCPILRIRGTT